MRLFCLVFVFGPFFGISNPFDSLLTKSKTDISFTENKGQVHDQFDNTRHDILFGGYSGELAFHLRKNGISYQLAVNNNKANLIKGDTIAQVTTASSYTIARIDLTLLNAAKNPVIQKFSEREDFLNFYNGDSENSACNVKSYAKIIYKNIYKGIDVAWYSKDNKLKYDYLLEPGADYKQIQIKVEGAQDIFVNENGELVIKTPYGSIIEQAPLVFQELTRLKSGWEVNNNVISFQIFNIDPNKKLIIDPIVRVWGTYYGGGDVDHGLSCAADKNGNVYMTGWANPSTGTVLATSGAHQVVRAGNKDAFLVKFNSNGVRKWGTYYGGSGEDHSSSCTVDTMGNVFIAGYTLSNNGIGTLNGHQSTFGGIRDGFLAKFDSLGVRQWATYYGGAANDFIYSCVVDKANCVYVCGICGIGTPSNVIATPGSHNPVQPSGGGFLAKFSNAGIRLWGTYCGNNQTAYPSHCSVDGRNNVFVAGITVAVSFSNAGIVSSSAHQTVYAGGNTDAFLAKYSSQGTFRWGTYYGAAAEESNSRCAADSMGNVFLAGTSMNPVLGTGTAIATPGSHMTAGVSMMEPYLAKFDSLGVRKWGTYYGGPPDYSELFSCSVDNAGSVFIAGYTQATVGIATNGSHQPAIFGTSYPLDGFISKFNTWGVRQWGTYYGGNDGDVVEALCHTANGIIYACGSSTSGNNIASAGSYQTTLAGLFNNGDAWLAKFSDCYPSPPVNATNTLSLVICSGRSATLSASGGTNSINWRAAINSTQTLATGTTYITPPMNPGTHTLYAEAFGCAASVSLTPIVFTVLPSPSISVISGSICLGQSFTLSPIGATSFSVNSLPQLIVTPSLTTTYSVTGTSTNGCTSPIPTTVTVFVSPLPTISVNSGAICFGDSITIVPSGANSYTIQQNQFVVSPSITTSYSVTGTSLNGCVALNAVIATVSVFPLPVLLVKATPSAICAGQITSLSVSGAMSFTWTGFGTSSSFTVTPLNSFNYTIDATDSLGCHATSSVAVIVNQLPTIGIAATQTLICAGQSATLTATGANSYVWTNSPPSNTLQVSPLSTTVYSVVGTDVKNCSDTAAIQITVGLCTEIDTLHENKNIQVHPNPVVEVLHITLPFTANASLLNELGQTISNFELQNGTNLIPTVDLSPGVYFLKFKNSKTTNYFKVIKQ